MKRWMIKTSRGMEVVTFVRMEGKKFVVQHGDTEVTCTAQKLKPVEESTGGPLDIPRLVNGIKVNRGRLIETMMYRNDRNLRHQARMAVEAGCTTFLSVYRWVMSQFKTRKSLRDCPRAFRRGAANVIAQEVSPLLAAPSSTRQ